MLVRNITNTTRIVIADDHDLVRQGMRTILECDPRWVVCGEAVTGRQAVTMTSELQPDLVILDVGLPEMNGIEVTRQIRRASEIAVLIVTMHDSDELVRDALEAGASGLMLKADAGRTLAEAVRAIVSHGRFISERVSRVAERAGKPVLTPRERQVLQLLAEGQANKDVAHTLQISPKTAETHRARIISKLDAHSVSDLVRYAIRNHIIDP
jgi:DNA-binding NarL/FixJ family response regulator